jgi:hypothetical protein
MRKRSVVAHCSNIGVVPCDVQQIILMKGFIRMGIGKAADVRFATDVLFFVEVHELRAWGV